MTLDSEKNRLNIGKERYNEKSPRLDKTTKAFQFKIPFEGNLSKEVQVAAYALDKEGKLLATAPVKEGQTELNLATSQMKSTRIYIGPSLEGKREHIDANLMERLHSYEATFTFDPKKRTFELMPIPEFYWKWWLWCKCLVRGKVVKPVTINGVTTDMPVCHARVHVCEVDPLLLLIPRLPDSIIDRLRKEIIIAIERPFPWPPEPDPGPLFKYDLGIAEASPVNIAKMNRAQVEKPSLASAVEKVSLNPQPEPPQPPEYKMQSFASKGSEVMFNPQPEPPGDFSKSLFSVLPLATKSALLSPSLETVKQALIANVDLIRPYLCYWPWIWPYFYDCDEIAVLETGPNGRFEKTILYLCASDHPDLYFWVEFSIGGSWTTVYHPWIHCHTYWDYVCGSEVIIRVTDPRVPWCGEPPDLPGKQVGIMSIGHNISLHQILGAAAGAGEGLTTGGQPFGGSLEPTVWFGQDDLIASGIDHYRWSYRRMDGIDTWHTPDRQVVRHYAVINPNPPYDLTFKPFLLGPDPAFPLKNLYKIQPKEAPLGSYGWAPMIDARENTASAFFLSYLLNGGDALAAAGKYELKLELFDSSGNVVNITDAGVLLKVPNIDGPFGPGTVTTIAPSPEHLILDGDGKVVAFRLVLHVDNNVCQAEIYPASVNNIEAGPCGFISYPPFSNVHISFKARHPNNFATFSFGTYKGSSGGLAIASVAFAPVGASPVNGFNRNFLSIFSKDIPAAFLVGPCPGGKAAFAETLHVDALATDGWSILEYLDADGVPKAFALEPGA